MKPFKETAIGKFLSEKAPGVLDAVGDVFPPVKILGALFNTTPDIPEADRLEFERMLKEYELNDLKAYLEDIQNARAMQIAALTQEDNFSKRFIYYLSSGLIFFAFIFDMCLFFVKYPEANRDMITMVCGILNTGALMAVVNFFLGSSKGSQDKQKSLNLIRTINS